MLFYGYWLFYTLFLGILLIMFGLAYLFHKPLDYGGGDPSSRSVRNEEVSIGRDRRDRRQSALKVSMMDPDIRNIRGDSSIEESIWSREKNH